jgi:hypothetical protein
VGHQQGGNSYHFSTYQPRIYSRKTPTRLDVDLTELSSRFAQDTSLTARSSPSNTETDNTETESGLRRHPRLGPLNTTNSVDSGSPLEFAHRQEFQHSASGGLPEPESAHLRPELGGGWPGRPRMMSV